MPRDQLVHTVGRSPSRESGEPIARSERMLHGANPSWPRSDTMGSTRQWLIALAMVCGCGGGGAEQDAPINARGDTYTVEQDRTLTVPTPGVLENDSSTRALPVYAEVGSSVAHGTLDARPDGGFTYTPERGFVGIDSFTYSATDLRVTSPPVTVRITVTAVSGAPAAGADGYTVA